MSIDTLAFAKELVNPRATAEQRSVRLSDASFGSGFTEHNPGWQARQQYVDSIRSDIREDRPGTV